MAGAVDILLDTSVLINFAQIDRIDLLGSHPKYSFFLTDHVRAEVLEHFCEQPAAMDFALETGVLTELTANSGEEIEDFGKLVEMKNLGLGECSAIAVAKHRSLVLAIDDIAARKQAKKLHGNLTMIGTEDIMVSLIREDILSVEEADEIKLCWETEHRFRLTFSSFAELL
jgi:predicted nucleic acid-binding protein